MAIWVGAAATVQVNGYAGAQCLVGAGGGYRGLVGAGSPDVEAVETFIDVIIRNGQGGRPDVVRLGLETDLEGCTNPSAHRATRRNRQAEIGRGRTANGNPRGTCQLERSATQVGDGKSSGQSLAHNDIAEIGMVSQARGGIPIRNRH